jgi:tetratricopeptide (TPR) repeat protein
MSALDNLAAFYDRTGVPVKAEPLLEKVLAIREKLLRPTHPSVAFTLNSLGNVYFDTGAYSRAQLSYERALAINEAELGPAHPDTAMPLHNLADSHRPALQIMANRMAG